MRIPRRTPRLERDTWRRSWNIGGNPVQAFRFSSIRCGGPVAGTRGPRRWPNVQRASLRLRVLRGSSGYRDRHLGPDALSHEASPTAAAMPRVGIETGLEPPDGSDVHLGAPSLDAGKGRIVGRESFVVSVACHPSPLSTPPRQRPRLGRAGDRSAAGDAMTPCRSSSSACQETDRGLSGVRSQACLTTAARVLSLRTAPGPCGGDSPAS